MLEVSEYQDYVAKADSCKSSTALPKTLNSLGREEDVMFLIGFLVGVLTTFIVSAVLSIVMMKLIGFAPRVAK